MITLLTTPATPRLEGYIEDFRSFAIRLHGDQRYGDFPYPFHLAHVEETLVANGYDDFKYRASGWLHDVLEDCDMSINRLAECFGSEIAAMVFACTGEGANRKERNASVYKKLAALPSAAPIKVADRIVNMKFSVINKSKQLGMYIREFGDFSNNVRPLMTNTTKDALLWNRLEDVVGLAVKRMSETKVA